MIVSMSKERFELLLDKKCKGKYFCTNSIMAIRRCECRSNIPQGIGPTNQYFDNLLFSKKEMSKNIIYFAGGHMEKDIEAVKLLNEQIKESKDDIEEIYNKIIVLSSQIRPVIKTQIDEIRTARMTAVTEIQMTMTALRDIRKFFLESDYEKEIQRLREFTDLCKEMKKLKTDGTLDALCDTAIKLAIKE